MPKERTLRLRDAGIAALTLMTLCIVRNAAGAIKTFHISGATRGTYPKSINASGMIAGYCIGDTALHGFLRTP